MKIAKLQDSYSTITCERRLRTFSWQVFFSTFEQLMMMKVCSQIDEKTTSSREALTRKRPFYIS